MLVLAREHDFDLAFRPGSAARRRPDDRVAKDRPAQVKDLVAHTDNGTFDTGYTASVASNDVAVIRVFPPGVNSDGGFVVNQDAGVPVDSAGASKDSGSGGAGGMPRRLDGGAGASGSSGGTTGSGGFAASGGSGGSSATGGNGSTGSTARPTGGTTSANGGATNAGSTAASGGSATTSNGGSPGLGGSLAMGGATAGGAAAGGSSTSAGGGAGGSVQASGGGTVRVTGGQGGATTGTSASPRTSGCSCALASAANNRGHHSSAVHLLLGLATIATLARRLGGPRRFL